MMFYFPFSLLKKKNLGVYYATTSLQELVWRYDGYGVIF